MRAWTVVITLELNDILISCVGLVELFCMVRLDEVVRVAGGEECWDETLLYVTYWCQLHNVEIRLASDRRPNDFESRTH